jgi:hypothetical protein
MGNLCAGDKNCAYDTGGITRMCKRSLCFFVAVITLFSVSLLGSATAQNGPSPSPAPTYQESGQWEKLPRMVLERQFAGPLQDTVIQRLRDPTDGTVCYLYLPISVAHGPTTQNGFIQYGPNGIGSINCMPAKQ